MKKWSTSCCCHFEKASYLFYLTQTLFEGLPLLNQPCLLEKLVFWSSDYECLQEACQNNWNVVILSLIERLRSTTQKFGPQHIYCSYRITDSHNLVNNINHFATNHQVIIKAIGNGTEHVKFIIKDLFFSKVLDISSVPVWRGKVNGPQQVGLCNQNDKWSAFFFSQPSELFPPVTVWPIKHEPHGSILPIQMFINAVLQIHKVLFRKVYFVLIVTSLNNRRPFTQEYIYSLCTNRDYYRHLNLFNIPLFFLVLYTISIALPVSLGKN